MSGNLTSVDISTLKLPDLLRLVEEVKATRTPRILKRESEPVAMLMPVGATIQRSHPHKRSIWTHYDPLRVKAALHQSAGALQGVDREELIRDLASQREQKSTGRPF
jgi:tRNA(fMet)-specific endonuclease VapC